MKKKKQKKFEYEGTGGEEQWTQGGVRGAGNTQRSVQIVNTGTNKF